MRISARNSIKGKLTSVDEGTTVMPKVGVDIGGGNTISSVFKMSSLKDLEIKIGDEVYVIINQQK